jgi:tetraacyldisaccharide 4'-kinase
VAILSRGYGSDRGPNDEALLLQENLPDVPHLQGADRVALALGAVEELGSEILILDDGFQHRRLGRTLDILVIDATRPWGYGHLLPRGLLRESPRGLRRAGAVVVTRSDQVSDQQKQLLCSEIQHLAPRVPVMEACHRPMEWLQSGGANKPLPAVHGEVGAFCGIGNPQAFRRTLESLGITVGEFQIFPDHHRYQPPDIEELQKWAGRLPKEWPILTTQKDLVKLRLKRLDEKELLALRIGLHIEKGEEAFHQLLNNVVTPLAV